MDTLFGPCTLGTACRRGPGEVELLLPRTMLVPGELFDAERGAEMLAANGMPPTAEESASPATRKRNSSPSLR